ncbi:MAG: membrane protein insertase YidC [Deltaproteobacteria bacterium]|nr:MAG: membrane protein insertase YidC [Deltaproteobacteria bacterium]
MDRRTILAVFASVGVFYLYLFVVRPFVYPEPEPVIEAGQQAPTAESEVEVGEAVADAPSESPPEAKEPAPSPKPAPVTVPERTVSLASCGASGSVLSQGGFLRSTEMDDFEAPYDVQPIYGYLWGLVSGGDSRWLPYGEPPGNQVVATDHARFLGMGSGSLTAPSADTLIEERDDEIRLRGTTIDGIEVQRTLTLNRGDPCTIGVDVKWSNPSSKPFDGQVWLNLHEKLPDEVSAYDHIPKPYWSVDGAWNSYTYPKTGGYMGLYRELAEPERQDGTVDWFGLSDGYFSVVMVPDALSRNRGRLVVSPLEVGEDEPLYGHHYVIDKLGAGESVSQRFTLYIGPNDSDALAAIHPTLYYLVDLGWFAFFGRPLLWLMHLYYSFVGNWGLSIILLTFTIKLVFFPLTQMAFTSSQRMAALQPELKELREKFKDNQEELNRRTMALFRDNKVNPIGGCLPMIIQMPIWISLYRVLLTSVDLYHTEFLYLKDLSVADPYAILPLIVIGLMFAQQQFMPTGNMDPAQARIMKLMPLVFGILFFSFPSGLVLYIFVNMLLTFVQQWYIKRRFKTAKPAPTATVANS